MSSLTEKTLKIIDILKNLYPIPECTLDYDHAYELLFSARLAAQCTDARVNTVTPVLFTKYPSLDSLAAADIADIEEIIKSCGFFHAKARDIVNCANVLVTEYNRLLPDTVEELIKLPGVGRKTANLIVGDVFKKPAVVTDTHCIRISNRLGLCSVTEPAKVESALREILPPEESSDFCHRLVMFGRDICTARAPKCERCPLVEMCGSNGQLTIDS